MSKPIAFVLFVLSLNVCSWAQGEAVEHGWTDKNNTEVYAAYMLQHWYNEQGYWGAKVETRQSGTKQVFVAEPGRIYRVGRFDVSGLSGLPEDAMKDSPKAGDVYSPNRVNEWIASIEKRDARRANWGAQFDQAHAQVKIEVKFTEGGLKPSPNSPRP